MAKKLKRRGEKKKSKKAIKTSGLVNLLKRVYLNGIFKECVLDIDKGTGRVEAVDITNSMIVVCSGRVGSKDITEELGLGNVELLINFLSTIDDEEMKSAYDTNTWTIQRSDGRRKLDYLLTNSDLIVTNINLDEEEDEDVYEKMSGMMEYKAELTATLIKDFTKFISLLTTKDVKIDFDGEDKLNFILGAPEDHQIQITLNAEIEGESGDGFEVTINGEHLKHVFSVIEYDDDDPPTISFADDETPVMVENGESAWFLQPLTGEYEEE